MFPLDTRILIIDDSPAIRQMVQAILQNIGFTDVQIADDGSSGYDLMTESYATGRPVQLVLADWHMTRISGYDLLLSIRQSPALKDLPFVMLTAENNVSEVLKAIRAGVSDYIVKPVDETALKSKLEAVYARLKKA